MHQATPPLPYSALVTRPLLECTPPWHRLDIRYPADLCEEVARMIGYEHIGATLLEDVLPTQRRNELVELEETSATS